MQHSCSPSVTTSYFPSAHFSIFSRCTLTIASYSWLSLYASCFLIPLILSGFFNEMLGVSDPAALKYHTFFRLMPLTLFVFRNITLIYLLLSGFLDSLLCDQIVPTPRLAFSLQMPRTLAAASSFSLRRVYPSLNFLPPLFLRLTPTLIMQGSTSL